MLEKASFSSFLVALIDQLSSDHQSLSCLFCPFKLVPDYLAHSFIIPHLCHAFPFSFSHSLQRSSIWSFQTPSFLLKLQLSLYILLLSMCKLTSIVNTILVVLLFQVWKEQNLSVTDFSLSFYFPELHRNLSILFPPPRFFNQLMYLFSVQFCLHLSFE